MVESHGSICNSQKPPQYADVASFPGYRVGDDGSVWTCWAYNGHQPRKLSSAWRPMKPHPDVDGYLGLNLYRKGHGFYRKVHLLVLEAFIGPRPPGLQGCHNNGHLNDCSASNLRWDTPANNQYDRLRHGTDCRGEKSPKAKLTLPAVLEIKQELAEGKSVSGIAREREISRSTINQIKRGKLWAWV